MHRSLSKLLQETQSAAAKRLGVLENTLAEDYPDHDGFADLLLDAQPSQSSGVEESNTKQHSPELLTLREFQIW